jgi:hypothetical protein
VAGLFYAPAGGANVTIGRLLAIVLWAAAQVGLAASAEAHPFHFSFAEGTWNEQTQRLEVALRLEPHDLEATLRQHAGRAVTLEAPTTEKLMQEYLQKSVRLETSRGKPAEIRWVGSEIKIKAVWLYFEVPLPHGLEGVKITNTLLLEHLPNQVNVMALSQGEQATALYFSAKKSTLLVQLRQKQASAELAEDPQ